MKSINCLLENNEKRSSRASSRKTDPFSGMFKKRDDKIITIFFSSLACLLFAGCAGGNIFSDSIHLTFQIGPETVVLPYLILSLLFFTVYIWYKRRFKPLHYAAMKGKTKDIESLIGKGVDVDIKNKAGLTPLHLAAEYGKKEAAEILIRNGADIESQSYYGFRPLHKASLNNRNDIVEILIQKGAEIDSLNIKHNTPLHCAAENGQTKVAKLLIAGGAKVNAKGDCGETPLHLAAYKGHRELVKLLVDEGAIVNKRDNKCLTPKACAEMEGHEEVVELLGKRVPVGYNEDVYNSETINSECCFLPAFDIFISYKSNNVEFVRQVVDQLIASGYNVWFAEYTILSIYDWRNENRFKKLISDGIRQSEWGVVFINSEYSTSDYCIQEAEQLVGCCGQGNILQIRLDDTEIPVLKGVSSLRCPTKDITDAICFISKHTGFHMNMPVLFNPKHLDYFKTGTRRENQIRLDITGWHLDYEGDKSDDLEQRIKGPVLHKPVLSKTGEEIMIRANLYYGIDYEATKTCSNIGEIKEDRDFYEELFEYARVHFQNINRDTGLYVIPRGVHLIIPHTGRGHLALTYHLNNCWARKISIHLPRSEGKQAYEFVFTFGFFGPFREYCRHAHLMDKLASSVEWNT